MEDLSARSAWYRPALADVVFGTVLLVALRVGHSELLNDPGTTWHIQVGIDTWRTGPPFTDAYSYTRAGQAWLSQSWLFDALLAVVFEQASWNGVVVFCAVLLGLVYRSLFRAVLTAPANVAWAAGLTLLAAGAGANHWLARPHLMSLWFFVLTYRWCRDFHRDGTRAIYLVPPLMALWSNVHAGFIGGIIVVAGSLAGHALTPPRNSVWRNRTARFAIVLGLSGAATLMNPYGWRLHAQLIHLLYFSRVRELIDEWGAPDFRSADMRPFEILILLAIAMLAWGRRRVSLFSLVHIGLWTHAALNAVRQVAYAAIVIGTVLGELSQDCWRSMVRSITGGRPLHWADTIAQRMDDWANAERPMRWPVWTAIASATVTMLVILRVSVPAIGLGVARLSPARWPVQAVERLNREPRSGPIFNDLRWGGYIILLSDPRRPVFTDDRFELYGRKFTVDYMDALQIGPAWKQLDNLYRFEFVLVSPDAPLARSLQVSPDWESLHADATAVLLARRPRIQVAGDSVDASKVRTELAD